MTTRWNDLPELKNILNDINVKKFDNRNIEDFKESVYYFISDYLKDNIRVYEKYNFRDVVYEDIYKVILDTYGSYIIDAFSVSIDIIINESLDLYFLIKDTPRSYKKTILIKEPDINHVDSIFEKLKTKEQPEQRTDEWYKFRRNLLTASNLWKAIDTQSAQNSLIFEKCKPINKKKSSGVNIESPFHQGHKYEPLSILMYEKMYKKKIGEFGCIKHDTIDFLGASPDGINIDKTNPRYGRLLEVKNPVSDRKLNGVPKKEYWIQMQLQMEVWDLPECDFLETRFITYDNEEDFNKDGTFTKTELFQDKGVIVQFYDGNEPIYKYPPYGIDKESFDEWYDKCIDDNNNLTWVRNTYWYLDKFSCSLVVRNKIWFDEITPLLRNIWDTIVKERETGYQHRAPKKREKKVVNVIKKDNIKTDDKKKSAKKEKKPTMVIQVDI